MSVESIRPMSSSHTVWRFPVGLILLASAVALVSLLPFWDGLSDMWTVWLTYPEYSHSLLMPPIAAFLVWQQKDSLERTAFEGSYWGVALIVIGGVLLLFGQLGTIYTLVEYAFWVTLCGIVLAITGLRGFRLFLAPLCVLFLMIPLPQFVFANLSSQLQLLSSVIGVWFMRLFGISVFIEGNVIDLGGYRLQVAEACDGLRYLFPLLTLGFLMAYFYKGALWKRVLLVLSSIPITVLMNSFRIGTIGFMVEHWGIAMAEGFLHEFQGWLVFMASAGLMLLEIAVLNRVTREAGSWRQLFGIEFPASTPSGALQRPRRLPRSFVVACSMVGVLAIVTWLAPRPQEIIPQRSSFAEFPLQIGDWRGERGTMERLYLDILKLDDYFMADYARGTAPVNLYMAFYNSQRKGEAVHSPRACLPGGGWQLEEFGQRDLPEVPYGAGPLRVNRTLIKLGDRQQLVYYWFDQRGRNVTNEFTVKAYIFWDALTRHRTDGALVRLIAAVPRNGSVADADRSLVALAKEVVPLTPRYIPK